VELANIYYEQGKLPEAEATLLDLIAVMNAQHDSDASPQPNPLAINHTAPRVGIVSWRTWPYLRQLLTVWVAMGKLAEIRALYDAGVRYMDHHIPEKPDLQTSVPGLPVRTSTLFRASLNYHGFLRSFIAFLRQYAEPATADEVEQRFTTFFREVAMYQERLRLEPPGEEERVTAARTEAKLRYWEQKRQA